MHLRRSRSVGLATVGVALCGLVATTAPAALAATRTAAQGTSLHIAITRHDVYVNGPTTFPAGRVNVLLDSGRKNGATFALASFKPGYSFHALRGDLRVAFANLESPNGNTKKGLRHLNHAIKNTTIYGGYSASGLSTSRSTLLLEHPGRYYLYDDTGNLPKRPVALTVTAPAGPQTLPTAAATVVAKTNRRFGGPKVLPHKGTIRFANRSSESPHFLVLQHVKEGTTRKQVEEGLQSNGQPSWLLPEAVDTDVVTSDQRMNLNIDLPKGEYAEMCFFPDPKTGMPHAFMGMIRIVHLK